jgi:hypothetical protein
MREWIRLASRPTVVRRALRYAVVVGAILIAINHGEAIVRGDISVIRLLRMALTMTVPYMVSTASSVSALRERSLGDPGHDSSASPARRG